MYCFSVFCFNRTTVLDMPANTKYLSSPVQRALKISAAILGGYFVAATFHLMLGATSLAREIVIVFSGISFFIVWTGLMVVAFLAKSGVKIWLLYLALTAVFGTVTWLLK